MPLFAQTSPLAGEADSPLSGGRLPLSRGDVEHSETEGIGKWPKSKGGRVARRAGGGTNPLSSEMVKRARELRKDPTPQERKLWYDFLRNHPLRFRRQQPIGPYIVDFFCPSARFVLELDGGGHYEEGQFQYDRRRDLYLEEQHMRVMRVTNLDIDQNFSGVCEAIERAVTPSAGFAGSSPVKGEPEKPVKP